VWVETSCRVLARIIRYKFLECCELSRGLEKLFRWERGWGLVVLTPGLFVDWEAMVSDVAASDYLYYLLLRTVK